MVTISKYYSSVTKKGVRPSNPGNVVTVIPEVLNPPDSPVGHSPVTIGSPANGLSLVGQELSLGIGAGLSIDVDNKIQLGNDGAGIIDISDLVQFSNGLQIRGTVDQNETVQEFGLRGTINPDSGPFLALSYFESGTGYQASATFGLDDFVIEAINENGNSLIRVRDQINSKGLENAGDYEASFTARSLVTKQYVTSAISGAGHNPVTISGTPNGLSIDGSQVLSLGLSSAGVTGALSGTDWSTFNGKLNLTSPITGYVIGANTALLATDTILGAFGKIQGQIGARVSGTGTINFVPKFTATGTVGNSTIFESANGEIGIGSIVVTNYSIKLARQITGSLVGYGITVEGQVRSDVTSSVRYFQSNVSLQATPFTLGEAYHYIAGQAPLSGGAVIGAQYGFYTANLTGATNNFGFRGDIIAGTGRWNIYMGGTANNYLAGNLWIGTTSGTNTLDVNGTTRIRTISNAVGNFLTTSATGVIQQRTAGEVATDIGAVTITGTQTITGAKTFDNSLLVLSGASPVFRIASNNNLATLNFRANTAEEKATLEFSDATNAFSIATRVNNSDISITPHGTGKIKLSNVPSGSGTVLAIDGSNNLVKSSALSAYKLLDEDITPTAFTSATFATILTGGILGTNSFDGAVNASYEGSLWIRSVDDASSTFDLRFSIWSQNIDVNISLGTGSQTWMTLVRFKLIVQGGIFTIIGQTITMLEASNFENVKNINYSGTTYSSTGTVSIDLQARCLGIGPPTIYPISFILKQTL